MIKNIDPDNIYDSDFNECVYYEELSNFLVFLFLPRSAQPLEKNRNIGYFTKRNICAVVFRSKLNKW